MSFFVSVGLVNPSAAEQSGDEEVLFAAEGKWLAQDISWTEYDGHWRVRTLATLVDISEAPLQFEIALSALCDEVVRKKTKAPEQVSRDDIYRVELNMRNLLPGDSGAPVFPYAIPIQVRQDECRMKPEGELYFNTYPGDLENWEFTKILYNFISTDLVGSGVQGITLLFRRIDPESSQKLAFLDACNAFFSDPSPALARMKHQFSLPDNLDGYVVRVVDFDDHSDNVALDAPATPELHVFRKEDAQLLQLTSERCSLWALSNTN
ncbi:hypothetical protein [Ruegeria sp. A3M17]|uniref:hypothetical protein n=1 Tax=Ruegeria sp. A3M17 TaxID=2267229 RepID=UPI0011BD856B|nr:hypothetical protein [Ruegeria sp. A3M17]